jgi:hypothetical protein
VVFHIKAFENKTIRRTFELEREEIKIGYKAVNIAC